MSHQCKAGSLFASSISTYSCGIEKHCHAIAWQGAVGGRGIPSLSPVHKNMFRGYPPIARIFWRMLKNYVSTGALDIA